MVYIAKIAINTDELHCKRCSDVDHKTIRQLGMPTLLVEVFQWFVTPFYCYVHSIDTTSTTTTFQFQCFFAIFCDFYSHFFANWKYFSFLQTNTSFNLFAYFFLLKRKATYSRQTENYVNDTVFCHLLLANFVKWL